MKAILALDMTNPDGKCKKVCFIEGLSCLRVGEILSQTEKSRVRYIKGFVVLRFYLSF